MRIRVARRMYGQFVAAGKCACYGELINPVSEVRGEPPYRTVFTVNPMENFEISEVLVSEEDMEKIQQLQEVLINVNGEVLARRKDGNTPTLEYYLTKVQTRYVEHKLNVSDDDFLQDTEIVKDRTPKKIVCPHCGKEFTP